MQKIICISKSVASAFLVEHCCSLSCVSLCQESLSIILPLTDINWTLIMKSAGTTWPLFWYRMLCVEGESSPFLGYCGVSVLYTRCWAGLLCWELWLLWKMSSPPWQRAAGQNSLCHLRSLALFVALPQNHEATGLDSTTEISSKYIWYNYFVPHFPGTLIKVKITGRVKRDEVLFPRTLVNFAVSTQNHSFQVTSFNHNMPCWHRLCTE